MRPVMTVHDLTASVIAVGLVFGVILLVGLGREVPQYLVNAFFAALSWVTRGAVDGFNNRRRPPAPPGE
jgi:hypothetical protein